MIVYKIQHGPWFPMVAREFVRVQFEGGLYYGYAMQIRENHAWADRWQPFMVLYWIPSIGTWKVFATEIV